MQVPEFDLLAVPRGTVTAPAGCGKTQLIAETLRRHSGGKPILVLTHTNAGVGALRSRLQRLAIPASAYRLATIDGWAMRIVAMCPKRSGFNSASLQSPRPDYPAIRNAAYVLLRAGHLNDALAASYSRLLVDEYQDCSDVQHAMVACMAQVLPTCVLGDPMQAIFGFRGNRLVDWSTQVLTQFPAIGELDVPWRWRNAGAEALGQWLLAVRASLFAGQSIDLRQAPNEVCWVQLTPATAVQQRLEAARTRPINQSGHVLVIDESISPQSQRQVASQTPGATTVEAVDLRDLTEFGQRFDLQSEIACNVLIEFGGQVMTNVGAPEMKQRIESLMHGRAINAPTPAEAAALAFKVRPSFALAATVLEEISRQTNVRVYRPEVLRTCLSALQLAESGDHTFQAATVRARDHSRHHARPISKRAVGSTLLLKGLEADVAVVLKPENMDAKHLYVALTRGARQLVICSHNPVLTPS